MTAGGTYVAAPATRRGLDQGRAWPASERAASGDRNGPCTQGDSGADGDTHQLAAPDIDLVAEQPVPFLQGELEPELMQPGMQYGR